MQGLGIAMIYVAFFSVIAIAIYVTGSAWPMLGLLLTPSMKWKGK